ncbi:hypothetical protein SAMN05421594_2256 [Chryseobacterium oleae]|uniref:YD repeat-containing protein n=1 Tax=Chryseobacterium oleae TaxID=491207 RepID=A0A1I4YAA7_CHROL|nr:hypothetical protein [Chryseobacterium oleae]SFN34935.1 hypothetical protein SAMN05421594_2256 [Chryseobacterium oleae]
MRKIEIILLLLFALTFTRVFPQGSISSENVNVGKYQKMIPPSPSAFAFSNYGNLPANLFIGTPRINIPLLEFKGGNITIPVTIDYTSAGVKIDQLETLVGQSWSFNTGGVITKKINGADDDFTPTNSPDSFTIMDQGTIDYFENFVETSAYNTEYDEFSFNFLGNSGKFLINKSGGIVNISPSDIKLERIYANGTNYFKATDESGIIYLFEAIEKTRYLKSACEGIALGEPLTTLANVAWYLTKIIHPSGNEIYFEYGDSQYTYTPSLSQQLKFDGGTQNAICSYGNQGSTANFLPTHTPTFFNCYSMQTNYIKVLKRISSNNTSDGQVLFVYDQEHVFDRNYKLLTGIEKKTRTMVSKTIDKIKISYLNTTNRHFLKDIKYENSNQKYQFEYDDPQSLPDRLNTSQDLWGYYNGASNGTYFVPKEASPFRIIGANREVNPMFSSRGILKRIIYPTGGDTVMEYEQNSYWGSKKIVHLYQTISGYVDYLTTGSVVQSSFFKYTKNFTTGNIDETEPVDVKASVLLENAAICPPFYNPDIPERSDLSVTLHLFDVDENRYIGIFQGPASINANNYMVLRINSEPSASAKVLLKANHNYQLKIFSPQCVSVDFGINTYYSSQDIINLPTGGIRLKKSIDNSGSNPVLKRYYYNTYSQRSISSGDAPETPHYFSSYETRNYCPNDPAATITPNCNYTSQFVKVIHSSPLFSLFDTSMNSNIFYEYVTESLGGDNAEKGRIEHKFNINRDASFSQVHHGNSLLGVGTGMISSGHSNTGWDHGNELETLYASSSNKVNKIIKRTFIKEVRDQTKYHNFIFNQIFQRKCLWVDTDLGNMTVGYYFKEIFRNLLNEEEIINYPNETTSLITKIKYFYNNPSHYQLTNKKVTYPNNNSEETIYSYAYEKGNQLMINKNMIGIPLETSTTQTIGSTAKILSKSETIYPKNGTQITNNNASLVLPLSAISYNIKDLNTSVSPPATTVEVSYDRYDNNGNLLQYTTKDGIPVSILWGYNKTLPIAKVEGITYDRLIGYGTINIPEIILYSDKDADPALYNLQEEEAENLLIGKLDVLRTFSLLSDYQISTYTYDPLIGVRSITPPSGIREVYKYDTANRLEKVIDVNGKVLKEYQYNYKN